MKMKPLLRSGSPSLPSPVSVLLLPGAALLLASMMIAGSATAAPEYYLGVSRYTSPGYLLLDSASADTSVMLSGHIEDTDFNWIRHLYYYGTTRPGGADLYMNAAHFGIGGTNWNMSSTWRWDDVVFTCQDGRPNVAGVTMDQYLKGYAVVPGGGLSNAARLTVGNIGAWVAASSNGLLGTSTGIFAGISSDTLDSSFEIPISPTFPTGVPVTVNVPHVTLDVYPCGTCGQPSDWVSLHFEADALHPGPGIAWNAMQLFNLPDGCTCNSVSAGIVDNTMPPQGPTSTDAPIEAMSWGSVKAGYR